MCAAADAEKCKLAAQQLPALVRTRFSMAGAPVGWVADVEVARGASAADVAMRDPLRRDEGSAPQGYTVEEAVLLLASSHPHLQRVGACFWFVCSVSVSVSSSSPATPLLVNPGVPAGATCPLMCFGCFLPALVASCVSHVWWRPHATDVVFKVLSEKESELPHRSRCLGLGLLSSKRASAEV